MLRWFRAARSSPASAAAAESAAPRWAAELTELVQKQSRASFKQAAQLEAAIAEQGRSLASMQSALERQASQLAQARERAALSKVAEYAPLFDALDGLDEAIRLAQAPELAAGLALVVERIVSVCERAGFRRVAIAGRPPEPRLCRVVGVEAAHGRVPIGSVCRVVQAPIVHAESERVVREGAAIVAADASSLSELESDHGRMGY